jgi:hypothetical protein
MWLVNMLYNMYANSYFTRTNSVTCRSARSWLIRSRWTRSWTSWNTNKRHVTNWCARWSYSILFHSKEVHTVNVLCNWGITEHFHSYPTFLTRKSFGNETLNKPLKYNSPTNKYSFGISLEPCWTQVSRLSAYIRAPFCGWHYAK